MVNVNQWIGNHLLVILIFLIVVIGINLYGLLKVIRKLKKYRNLLQGNEGKNLESLLLSLSEKSCYTDESMKRLTEDFTISKTKAEKYFQNWNLVRFKAFENTGGDQSFALALLDSRGNGVVMSSIFGREESRVYCKSIQEGVSNYPLSNEEKEAIQKAMGIEKSKF